MSPNAGMWGGGGCGFSANEYSCAHGAQINFGDLTPYLHGCWPPYFVIESSWDFAVVGVFDAACFFVVGIQTVLEQS